MAETRLARGLLGAPGEESRARHHPALEYPGHGLVRRVSNAGTCRLKSRPLFLSDTWLQEWIAREVTGDGLWSIYFYDVLLARLDERDVKLSG